MERIDLSIVIPVYKGEIYLNTLFKRILELRNDWLEDQAPIKLLEVIFVNDCAVDSSEEVIQKLIGEYPWVQLLSLSKNFGQHPATIAGILHSSGNWVVTIDEDLQHPPEKIGLLLRKAVNDKLDIVYASSLRGPHGKLSRDLTSVLFKKLMVFFTGDVRIPLYSSFRLLKGDIARSAASVCSHNTFLDVSFGWFTNSIGDITIELSDVREDYGSNSGYSWNKLFGHAWKLALSAKMRVYRLVGMFGVLAFLAGVVLTGFIVISEFISPGTFGSRGWPSLMVTIMIFSSISLILSSIILEYISSINLKSQGKPVFFIRGEHCSLQVKDYLNEKYVDN